MYYIIENREEITTIIATITHIIEGNELERENLNNQPKWIGEASAGGQSNAPNVIGGHRVRGHMFDNVQVSWP